MCKTQLNTSSMSYICKKCGSKGQLSKIVKRLIGFGIIENGCCTVLNNRAMCTVRLWGGVAIFKKNMATLL